MWPGLGKLALSTHFVFEKYLFEIFNALSFSCDTIQSRQMCHINSVVI